MIFVTLPLLLLFIKTVYAGKDRPHYTSFGTSLTLDGSHYTPPESRLIIRKHILSKSQNSPIPFSSTSDLNHTEANFGSEEEFYREEPVFSDELTELIEMIHDECVDQTGVAEEDIKNCELGIFKDDEKLKCYMFCIMEEAGLVDDDLVLDYDLMFSLVPEKYLERLQNMLNPCRYLDTLDKPKCQRSFDVHKCTYERDPDFYYIF